MFQGSLTSVLREFQCNFREAERVVQRCFKDVSRKLLLHESLERVTRMI